jgi:hypothetical protein
MDPVLKHIATAMTVAMLATLAIIFTLSGTHVAAGRTNTSQAHAVTAAARAVNVRLVINANGPHGWPTFTLSRLKLPDNAIVHLTIVNNDNGGGALAGPFGQPQGLIGPERVNGKAITLSNVSVAHTFTVPALGVNIVVPTAPNNGTVTVEATFRVTRTGSFRWQCMAPCGTGATGWSGPMATVGYMTGNLEVQG